MSIAKESTLAKDRTSDFDAIEVYGHSWAALQRVASAAGWWPMLGHSLGVSVYSRALGGTRLTSASGGQGGWDRVLSTHSRYGDASSLRRLSILMHGLNDAGYSVPTSLFISVARTVIRRLQATATIEDTDASVVYGGTWTSPSSAETSGLAYKQTVATGATATITIPTWVPAGSVIVLRSSHNTAATAPFAATNGGTYSVTRNGTAQAAWAINRAGALGTTHQPDSYELTVNPGDTIVLNATAVTSAIRFDGYDVVTDDPQPVLVALPGRARTHITYLGDNPTLTAETFEANVMGYREPLAALCAELGVKTFDLERALNKEREFFQADQLHPNAHAQTAIARAALESLGLAARREIGTPAPYGEVLVSTAMTARTSNIALATGSPGSAISGYSKVRRSVWMLNVTAVSGTTPTMVFRIVGYQPYDGVWVTVAKSEVITAPGRYAIVVEGGCPDHLATELDLTGTTPSFTFNVVETHQGLTA